MDGNVCIPNKLCDLLVSEFMSCNHFHSANLLVCYSVVSRRRVNVLNKYRNLLFGVGK